ncbi:MAG: hypothetical protein A2340_10340 [Lentisphaerae bacterium RIFOXYB12_FULL_60_10]|nr:MAG: hypothetical protein A2340_10340 [Lentisphaerae bacterium RIFOXYB12_FULL_60_10]
MKRKGLAILGICIVLAGCATIPTAPSLGGRWEGAWQFSDGSYIEKFSFDLVESGRTVTGSGVDEKGIAAKVTGEVSDTSFTLTVVPEDGSDPIVFSGKIDTISIHGVWEVGGTTGPWAAEKR